MSATLLLRLDGPMQSWGTRSRFDDRDTERMPSKSGVIGLLCAAEGRPRRARLDDLVALKMAVRVDLPGVLEMDFHTAQAGVQSRVSILSRRYYLSDAAFLVALEGNPDLLGSLQEALTAPHWPLFLGRKSFPPGSPVHLPDGFRPNEARLTVLQSYPWLGEGRRLPRWLLPEELVIEDECGPGEDGSLRADVPLSFETRDFTIRRVLRRTPVPLSGVRPGTKQEKEDVSEQTFGRSA